MAIRNGQKPLSQRAKPTPLNMDDIFGNVLGIDPELMKEIEAQNLVPRFINAAKLQQMGGYHQYGWTPYKRKQRDTIDSHAFTYGASPDGLIHRGDCVLAVRPKELNDKHKQYIREEAERRSISSRDKAAAEKIREFARDNNLGLKVDVGYGEDDEQETE